MKFLTLHQPLASLIAVGAKTIETRPFSTQYRGPLAIHAGKAEPAPGDEVGMWVVERGVVGGRRLYHARLRTSTDRIADDGRACVPLPLGAVVAVCDLVDVVPIVPERGMLTAKRSKVGGQIAVSNPATCPVGERHTRLTWKNTYGGRGLYCDKEATEALAEQLPFGDFTPGRYAWLLSNVRPIEPVPMKGVQGLRDVDEAVLRKINERLAA